MHTVISVGRLEVLERAEKQNVELREKVIFLEKEKQDYLARMHKIEWQAEAWRYTTTCSECNKKVECPFAFDAYNTNGDCLAIK